MNTEHTPGPWRVGDGSFVISDHPTPGITGSDDVHIYGGHLICESVSQPNARLIAAAPDLLAALKELTSNPHVNLGDLVYKVRDSEGEGWDGPQVKRWSDAVQAARAAIAKAEGKA